MRHLGSAVIARSAATKQSRAPVAHTFGLDCFAPLAMTMSIQKCASAAPKPQLPGSSFCARSRSRRAFFAFDTDQSCQKPKSEHGSEGEEHLDDAIIFLVHARSALEAFRTLQPFEDAEHADEGFAPAHDRVRGSGSKRRARFARIQ